MSIESTLISRSANWRLILWSTLMLILTGSVLPGASHAYTPESPEVKALIAKAVRFLETSDKSNDNYYKHLGGSCVVGLSLFKNGAPKGHPLVAAALKHCAEYRPSPPGFTEDNYSIGLAIIFLCEVDPVLYRADIDKLMAEMLRRQRNFGAWTYDNDPEGDTSQTQYSALAMWIAHRSDIPVPTASAERCANWLLRTQAPNGGFTYKAVDPGNFNRINQKEDRMTPTMGAAGTGSLMICAEVMGYIEPPDLEVDDLPPAVREVQATGSAPKSRAVDATILRRGIVDGIRWMSQNQPTQVPSQQLYYMYSLERYQAFRELTERKFEKEPAWYNNGVAFLSKTQAAAGSWSNGEQGANIDTAFAILFLLRSAKKTIAKVVLESGSLSGSKGNLPKDLSDINVTNSGKVVSNALTGAVDDVLRMLEDPSNPQREFLADIPEEVRLEEDPAKRNAQMARFRRLAMGGSFQARLTAVKTLSRVRDLENVPTLIYALSDPDSRIAQEARKGLRFTSRRIEDFGPVEDAKPEQRLEAIKLWSEWFKSIRPDGELIE